MNGSLMDPKQKERERRMALPWRGCGARAGVCAVVGGSGRRAGDSGIGGALESESLLGASVRSRKRGIRGAACRPAKGRLTGG